MNLVSDGIDRMGIESINFMVHLPSTCSWMRISWHGANDRGAILGLS